MLRGPVMRGHAILTAAAERADPERAVAMLAEAAFACLLAGNPAEMLAAAERARASLPARPSVRARFLAAMAAGHGPDLRRGRGAQAPDALHEAVTLAEGSAEVRDDLRLMPWLATGPLVPAGDRHRAIRCWSTHCRPPGPTPRSVSSRSRST